MHRDSELVTRENKVNVFSSLFQSVSTEVKYRIFLLLLRSKLGKK